LEFLCLVVQGLLLVVRILKKLVQDIIIIKVIRAKTKVNQEFMYFMKTNLKNS
jgi:hypothetical protein